MAKTDGMSTRRTWVVPLVTAGVCLLVFHAVGDVFLGGYRAASGSLHLPVSDHMFLLALWTFFGGATACFLAVGLWRLPSGSLVARLRKSLTEGTDRTWLGLGCLAALLAPVFLHIVVLQGSPLTDDETCYEFLGRLLASGRVKAVSPPAKLFYDHTFMINDGHLYPQYFAGWPLVMVPFVWLGIPGFANAVCSSATVPALYMILKDLTGRVWARCGLVLYLVSPFLMIGAATRLSHTSCILALTWMAAVFLKIRGERSRGVLHAVFFALFSLAFLIRPTAALGIGLPLLVAWLAGLRRETPRGRLIAISSGALVSAFGALVFLGINQAQTGSPFMPAYQRYITYAIENGCRFSYLPSVEYARQLRVVNMQFGSPVVPLAMMGAAAFRMNYALFGWPVSLLFVPFGLAARRVSLFAWSLLTFVAAHLFIYDVGVDPFGPVHFAEAAVPLIVLTVAGLARLAERFREAAAVGATKPGIVSFPSVLALALCLVSSAGYIPISLRSLAGMGAHLAQPFRAAAALDAGPIVVFAGRPFAPPIGSGAQDHFLFYPPVNDPELKNQVLWVNHVTLADDRRFMQFHPGRKGFVLQFPRNGDISLVPLDDLRPGDVPDAEVGGSGEGPDWAAVERDAEVRTR